MTIKKLRDQINQVKNKGNMLRELELLGERLMIEVESNLNLMTSFDSEKLARQML